MRDLDAAADALARVTGAPVRPFSTYDFGRMRDSRCRSVVLPEGRVGLLLAEVRVALPDGWVGYVGTTRWLGDERHEGGAELAAGPGESPFDIVRLARTNGVNYDLDTEALIERLRRYDDQVGIDITHAETDTVELNFARMPNDVRTFARDVYAFCPDIGDQGVGTLSALEAMIEGTGSLYLWWD